MIDTSCPDHTMKNVRMFGSIAGLLIAVRRSNGRHHSYCRYFSTDCQTNDNAYLR